MAQFLATKRIPAEFSATADGDGLWGMECGHRVQFTEIQILASMYECIDDPVLEIRFWHEKVPYSEGLCYTDEAINNKCKEALARIPELSHIDPDSINGSEQGMQYHSFYSCDADLKKDGPSTQEDFEKLGYEIEH